MATNTKTSSELKGGNQPLYQPWDDVSGRPQNKQPQNNATTNGSGIMNYDNPSENPSTHFSRNQSAVNALRTAEQNAVSKNREEPSLYTGNGRNNVQFKSSKKKKSSLAAIILMLAILGGGAAFLGSSNTLLLDAIENRFTSQTNYQGPSFVRRAKTLFKYFMNGDSDNAPDNLKKYFVVSDEFEQKLAKNGITFENNGTSKTMTWTHKTDYGTETLSGIDGDQFDDLFRNNVEFRKDYTLAANNTTLTYFDDSAEIKFRQLGTTRNAFHDFQATNDPEVNTQKYKDTLSPKFDGDTTSFLTSDYQEEKKEVDKINEATGKVELDENGNPVKEVITENKRINNETDIATTSTNVDATSKAKTMLNKLSFASGGSGWTCTVMRLGNMVSMAVAANEMYSSIQFFMGLMEPISKTKAGFGSESPIHEVLNWFNTKANTSTSLYDSLDIDITNEQGTITKFLDQNGSPLQANGVQMILSGATNDTASASAFSHERINNSLGNKLFGNTASAQGCAVRDITDSIISISVTLASGGLSKVFASVIRTVVIQSAASITISSFFKFLVPTIASVFFVNAFENAVGMPGGEKFSDGADTLGSVSARANSGIGPASKTKVEKYNQVAQQVGALEAEVDRYTLSPFDTSNPNTFFGSIAYSFLPVATSNANLSSILHSVSTSFSSLLGGAKAAGEGSSFMTNFGDYCPNLDANGASGSRYCNPPPAGTNNIDPSDSTYQAVINKGQECDANGNCKIKAGSELATYITVCKGRVSPSGITDQNILAALQPSNSTGDFGTILNSLPIVGDIIQLVDGAADLQNIDWANDLKCSDTDDNAEWWNEKGQYYAQYVEDMRVLDIMGSFDETDSKNPVLSYEEEYEKQYLEEHPEANTYIGYLSRISGLTPKNTEAVLAFIDYVNYINSYDPTLRIAMNGDTSEIKDGKQVVAEIHHEKLFFESNEIDQADRSEPIIVAHDILYIDTRNRNFAIC